MQDDKIDEIVISGIESEASPEVTVTEASKKEELDMDDAENVAQADVKKSADAVKPAEAPKPKTKAAAMEKLMASLQAMKKDDLMAAYDAVMDTYEVEMMDDEEETKAESFDHKEELNKLVESEVTLSDEFKTKSAMIFEVALNSKVKAEIDVLEERYTNELSEEVALIKSELVEKVDSYLGYVVETYIKENEVAISNGLRTEIAEEFMTKLKQVFVESYIEVPESKVDLVDDLSEQVIELEDVVNSNITKIMELTSSVEVYQRKEAINECSHDLAQTEIEKLTSLVENVDFDTYDSFVSKVNTIKESYFAKEAVQDAEITQSAGNVVEEIQTGNSAMDKYTAAIRKHNPYN